MATRKFLDYSAAQILNTLLHNKFATKQDTLTAGNNITIDSNNEISVDATEYTTTEIDTIVDDVFS